ncbi:MAG TPA: proton-conducting transporter membrane subunit, partial [Anseongella sp.]|nr:proton-conducting transporter membrane subunit [Anseongella sp.]
LPVTFVTMLLASLAISGIPPFSGFFSKDEILAHAFSHNPLLWAVGFGTALLTAFYMFRMMYLTFWGNFRGTAAEKQHLHESPSSMKAPLVILAILSVAGGFLGLPEVFAHNAHLLGGFLEPVFAASSAVLPEAVVSHSTEWLLMGISVLGVLASIGIAYSIYVKKGAVPAEENVARTGLAALSYHKFYIDELYDLLVSRPLNALSAFFYRVMDVQVIDGIVNGIGKAVSGFSGTLRLLQEGRIGSYMFYMVAGVILIFVLNYLIF